MTRINWLLKDFLAFGRLEAEVEAVELEQQGIRALVLLPEDRAFRDRFSGWEIWVLEEQGTLPDETQLHHLIDFLRLVRLMGRAVLLPEESPGPFIAASFLVTEGISPAEAAQLLDSPRQGVLSTLDSPRQGVLSTLQQEALQRIAPGLRALCQADGDRFQDLALIMRTLRSRCPWDREQTHASLTKYLLEEAWELVAAVRQGDPQAIRGELGDVLLEVVFHSVIAEEEGAFTLEDVVRGISEKLLRRHPHVFEEHRSLSPRGVESQWESIKDTQEKRGSEQSARRYMPALMRAERIQEIAAHKGLDWKATPPVLDKAAEELEELRSAVARGERSAIEEEAGDLLFSLVNLCRRLRLNPEEALHGATDKFLERSRKVEQAALQLGQRTEEMSEEELDVLWQESKKQNG